MQATLCRAFLRIFLLHLVFSHFIFICPYGDIQSGYVSAQNSAVTVERITKEVNDGFRDAKKSLQEAEKVQNEVTLSVNELVQRAKEIHENTKKLGKSVFTAKKAIDKAYSGVYKTEEESRTALRAAERAVKKAKDAEQAFESIQKEMNQLSLKASSDLNFYTPFQKRAEDAKKDVVEANELIKKVKGAHEKVKQAAESVNVAEYEVKTTVAAYKISEMYSSLRYYTFSIESMKRSAATLQKDLDASLTDISNELKESIKSKLETIPKAFKLETEEIKILQDKLQKLETSQKEANDYVKQFTATLSLDKAEEIYEKSEVSIKKSQSLQQGASSSYNKIRNALANALIESNIAIAIAESAKTDLLAQEVRALAIEVEKEKERAEVVIELIRSAQNNELNAAVQIASALLQVAQNALTMITQIEQKIKKASQEVNQKKWDVDRAAADAKKATHYEIAGIAASRATSATTNAKKKKDLAKQALNEMAPHAETIKLTMHKTEAIVASSKANASVIIARSYATQVKEKQVGAQTSLESLRNAQTNAPPDVQTAVADNVAQAEKSLSIIRQKCEEAEQLAHEAEKETTDMHSIVSAAEEETSTQEAEARAMKATQIAKASKTKEETSKQALDEVAQEVKRIEITVHKTTAIVASANTHASVKRAKQHATQVKEKQSEAQTSLESLRNAQTNAPPDVQTAVADNVAQAEKSLSTIVDSAKVVNHAAIEAEAQKRVADSLLADIEQHDINVNDAKSISEKCHAASTAATAEEEAARAALLQIVSEMEQMERIVQTTKAMIASASKEIVTSPKTEDSDKKDDNVHLVESSQAGASSTAQPKAPTDAKSAEKPHTTITQQDKAVPVKKAVDLVVREVDNGLGDNGSLDNINDEFPSIYIFEL